MPLSSLVGRALAAVVGTGTRLRPAPKLMHPRGAVTTGTLRRLGGAGTGAAFLDDPGTEEVLVRLSRSAGLPEGWPDVNGLAVRWPGPGGPGDVLLSGTGTSALGRFLLAPARRSGAGFVGSLVPYRTPTGPVHLGARTVEPGCLELVWARPRERWQRFATLELGAPLTTDAPDAQVSFDAIAHVPAGLAHFPWYVALRGPSYAAARRVRGSVDAV